MALKGISRWSWGGRVISKRFISRIHFLSIVVGFVFVATYIDSTAHELSLKSLESTNGTETDSQRGTRVSKPTCPMIPPGLIGRKKVNISVPTWEEVANHIGATLSPEGRFQPRDCTARDKIAVIIPYRDREEHLKILLRHIHPLLQRQLLDYQIYVVEQDPRGRFNTGLMKNVGFMQASKIEDYDCYVFHDVDKVPEDDRNMYTCSNMPRHVAVALSKLDYQLRSMHHIGGAVAMTKEQFEVVNGYSNIYFGWGGDDTELRNRIKSRKMTICRYTEDVARYTALEHPFDTPNKIRWSIIRSCVLRMETDGLNSLSYKLLKKESLNLYTRLLVYVNETDVMEKEPIHKINLYKPKKQKIEH